MKTAMKEEIHRISQRSDTRELIRFHLCGTTFPDPHYRIERSAARFSCIEFIEEGSGTVIIDGETFHPEAGDSYFLQAGREHCYFSHPERPWKKHFINLSGPLCDKMAEACGVSRVSHFRSLDLSGELARIIAIGRDEADDSTTALTSIVTEIFLKMHSHLRSAVAPAGICAEMKDFLDTQITSDFRLDTLCRRIAKSESQTIRLFRDEFGVTPYSYVLSRKLSFARHLLEDTNLSVGEIAEKLCFADAYYFSGLFKRKIGMTPTAYRNSMKKR